MKKISAADSVQKRSITKSISFVFTQYNKNETQKFDNIRLDKKDFHKSN